MGIGGEWESEGRPYHPQGDQSQCCILSRAQKQLRTVNLVGPDSRQQQFDTSCSPINAPQWLHIPCSGLSWSYRVGKMLPVKADLAIYSPIIGESG